MTWQLLMTHLKGPCRSLALLASLQSPMMPMQHLPT